VFVHFNTHRLYISSVNAHEQSSTVLNCITLTQSDKPLQETTLWQ